MNIVDRAKNIVLTPKTEWPVIGAEGASASGIVVSYVIPLALIPAVATILGHALFGEAGISMGIATGIAGFITAVAGAYITAFVVNFLAPNFGSQKDYGRAMQLVAYSWTPGWLAGILNIYPPLRILVLIASLYGLYLIYLGLPHTMKTPGDKVVAYMVVTIIVLLIVYLILGAILGVIMLGIFGLSAVASMAS